MYILVNDNNDKRLTDDKNTDKFDMIIHTNKFIDWWLQLYDLNLLDWQCLLSLYVI